MTMCLWQEVCMDENVVTTMITLTTTLLLPLGFTNHPVKVTQQRCFTWEGSAVSHISVQFCVVSYESSLQDEIKFGQSAQWRHHTMHNKSALDKSEVFIVKEELHHSVILIHNI